MISFHESVSHNPIKRSSEKNMPWISARTCGAVNNTDSGGIHAGPQDMHADTPPDIIAGTQLLGNYMYLTLYF